MDILYVSTLILLIIIIGIFVAAMADESISDGTYTISESSDGDYVGWLYIDYTTVNGNDKSANFKIIRLDENVLSFQNEETRK